MQFLADQGAKIEVWNRKNKYGWTPLAIAQGYRPGNFKPSAETIAALEQIMRTAGVSTSAPTDSSGATATAAGDYKGNETTAKRAP